MESNFLVEVRKQIQKKDAINLIGWLNGDEVMFFMNEDEKVAKLIEGVLNRHEEVLLTYYLNQRNIFFMIDYNKEPVGFTSLTPIGNKTVEVVIAIGEKELWGRGIGKQCLSKVRKFCFDKMNFDKVVATVHNNNSRLLSLFKNSRFSINKEQKVKHDYNYLVLER